jgi:hypothetical protein
MLRFLRRLKSRRLEERPIDALAFVVEGERASQWAERP